MNILKLFMEQLITVLDTSAKSFFLFLFTFSSLLCLVFVFFIIDFF